MNWYLYILECSDKTLYTGITKDLENRIKKHNLGVGAKAIRGRLPVSLAYSELYNSHSEALKREAVIKKLSRNEKVELIRAASSIGRANPS